jgi:hypothetical protein
VAESPERQGCFCKSIASFLAAALTQEIDLVVVEPLRISPEPCRKTER